MKRLLLESNAFITAAKKMVNNGPRVAADVKTTLYLLSRDAFDPRLKTHKLKGPLIGSLACSVSYNLRIIFKIVKYENSEAILLETIGTHDEVY